MKNLLEPEVGLATSMLQTLRDATEEEYRDALARDAARNSDAVPEESARNVVIIVKPRASDNHDDFVSEASNIKEARCINPVGTSLGRMRTVSNPLKTLPDFFRLPKARQPDLHRNLWDMDSNVGASNVQQSVVDKDGGAPELKPRSPLFKLGTPLKENGNSMKTPTIIDKLEQTLKNRPNLFERFNLPIIPKMKIDNPLRKANNNKNSDLSPTPSRIQEFIEKEDDEDFFKFNKRPLMLKNLLNLKDVELIPKTISKIPRFKSKLNTQDLALPTSLNRDADIKCDGSLYDSAMNEKVLMPKKVTPTTIENVEAKNTLNGDSSLKSIVNGEVESEEDKDNQDALQSPSEIIPIILDNTQTVELDDLDCKDVSLEEITTSTTENIQTFLEDNGSSDNLDPAVKSEIFEDLTENEDDWNTIKDCETNEASENENEISEIDMISGNSIATVTPFTLQDSEESVSQLQVEKPEQDTINHSNDGDEDFNSVPSIEDQVASTEIKPELISKKCLENSINRNLRIDTPITEDQEPRKYELFEEPEDSKSKVKENLDGITFNDLQKLSDDLLVLSSNQEQDVIPKEADIENGSSELDFKSNQEEITEEIIPDILEAEPTTISDVEIPKEANIEPLKGKACRVGFDENKTKQKPAKLKSAIQDENSKDMTVEASAPKANTLPAIFNPLNLNEQLGSSLLQNINPLDPLNLNENLRSPLLPNLAPLNLNDKLRSPILPNLDPLNLNLGSPLNLNEKLESLLQSNFDPLNVRSSIQDIIVQPSISDDPLHILGKPMGDVFKLPTLEDLRQRFSSVFDTNDRSAENNFSDEEGDCSNDVPVEMAPAASTSNFRKISPIRPLEDMNIDIFQLNPLSKTDSLTNTPRLNLNNFRTRLPIPDNLDLKPVKLESRVGNNKGNLLGASLTFGNDKATLRKAKPNSDLLGHPKGGIPSLDELRDAFHSNTQSLLGTPLHSNLDLFRDSSLGASGIPDIDEIRRNAEKTMKGLQQRMKSTFKGNINNPLSEKFARPQDLLEDVNDKLKAIHYDLNDRLSSIHEDILDQTRLKPLRPTFPSSRNTNKNIMNNIRKTKAKPARLQVSASTISSQEVDPFQNTNDRNLLRAPARNPKRVHTNSHRILLGAESSPVASKVEFPKTKTSVDIPRKTTLPPLPRLPSLKQGSESLFPQNIRGKTLVVPRQPGFVKDLKRPILRKPNPFKDKNSKVTITFTATTPSPVTSSINKFRKPSSVKPDIKPDVDSLKERLALPRSKTLGDAKQSASEPLSRISTPLNSKTNFKTANSGKDHPQLQSLEPMVNTKSKVLPSFKGFKESKLRLNENNSKKLDSSWNFVKPVAKNVEKIKPLVWPTSDEDSFLAKVREAMQARLKSFNPSKAAEKVEIAKIERPNTDMIRSASENNDVIVDEPIKENVPYKCRMLCTRE